MTIKERVHDVYRRVQSAPTYAQNMYNLEMQRVLRRIGSHLPESALPAFSQEALEKTKPMNAEEKRLIGNIKMRVEQMRQPENQSDEKITYESLQGKFTAREKSKSPEERQKKEGITEDDIEAIAFLIKEFSDMSVDPFDQQILATVRAISSAKNPQSKGVVIEMPTSAGKSLVMVPIVTAYMALKEEHVQIHSVNPYLVERDFERFKVFADKLGIGRQVDYLNSADKTEALSKRVVFGMWSNYIHAYQREFTAFCRNPNTKHSFPAKPFIIMDEIDQIMRDENQTPATIAEKASTRAIFIGLAHELGVEIRRSDTRSGNTTYEFNARVQSSTKNRLGRHKKEIITTELSPKEYLDESMQTLDTQIEILFKNMRALVERAQNQGTLSKNDQEIRNFLIKRASLSFFKNLIASQYLDREVVDPTVRQLTKAEVKKAQKDFESTSAYMWWENPHFQNALIEAFVLERGRDYEIIGEDIIPISRSTGYGERGKEYESLTIALLYLKERLQIPPEISGGATDTLTVAEFYDSMGKIIGFTGSGKTVARRLFDGFGLETQMVPEIYKSKRRVNLLLVKNQQEKEMRAAEVVNQSAQNALLVTDSTNSANHMHNMVGGDLLTSQNENQDKVLYAKVSTRADGQRKILTTAKMVGRGVDLTPDDAIRETGGFLLVSMTPFEFERTYEQLIGRIGRRDDPGRAVILLSPDDPVFQILPENDRNTLNAIFNHGSLESPRTVEIVHQFLERAWGLWEDRASSGAKSNKNYYSPFVFLRKWVMNTITDEEKEFRKGFPFDDEALKTKIAREWPEFMEQMKNLYSTWGAAGQFGPFGVTRQDVAWGSAIFEMMNKWVKLHKMADKELRAQHTIEARRAMQVLNKPLYTMMGFRFDEPLLRALNRALFIPGSDNEL